MSYWRSRGRYRPLFFTLVLTLYGLSGLTEGTEAPRLSTGQEHCAPWLESVSGTTPSTSHLGLYLSERQGTSDDSTVHWSANRNGKVIFLKKREDLWLSRHPAIKNTFTQEGDLRLPMFVMGADLAEKMGFDIKEVDGDNLEIEIPDSQTLATVVSRVNESLKARHLEPISYLPVRTGIVTIPEFMRLILSANGDYLIYFPFDDMDSTIVPHEASFHLGSMLLPREVLLRTRIITQEAVDFINEVRAHENELGPIAKKLTLQILRERNFELDAGFASMVTTPGHARRDGGMKSYSELFPEITEKSWNYMARDIEYLCRPELQPYEAVLYRLQMITGIDIGDLIHNDVSGFTMATLELGHIGAKVALTPAEAAIVRSVAEVFASRPREPFSIKRPRGMAEDYIRSLDHRIEEILLSF